MYRKMCKSKICGLKVTGKSIEYEGSIKLPPKVLEEADILPGEMVLVINLCNGERFNTYAMKGKTGECWVLGGAARLSEIGDKLLIISYGFMETKEATHYTPKIITLDEKNQIIK